VDRFVLTQSTSRSTNLATFVTSEKGGNGGRHRGEHNVSVGGWRSKLARWRAAKVTEEVSLARELLEKIESSKSHGCESREGKCKQ
jgi:hypothetical protein